MWIKRVHSELLTCKCFTHSGFFSTKYIAVTFYRVPKFVTSFNPLRT